MKTTKIEFEKNESGHYVADIVLPGRVNVYCRLQKQGSVKVFAVVEGITEPTEVGCSEYSLTPVLDINLIAGTTIRLQSWSEVAEAAYISEEDEE